MNLIEMAKRIIYPNNIKRYSAHVKIHDTCIVKPGFTINIRGEGIPYPVIEAGENSVLRGSFNIENKNGKIKIGKNCNIGAKCSFYSNNGITLGDNVLISWNCTFYDNDAHPLDPKLRKKDIDEILSRERSDEKDAVNHWCDNIKNWDSVSSRPINIEDDVWIGFNSIILKGVTIGKGTVIGAGSVVTHDVPEYCVAAGNPARTVKKISAGKLI